MKHVIRGLRALALAGFVATVGAPAEALVIDPGFDLFITSPDSTSVDLSVFGGPPIVPLKGVPLVDVAPPTFAGLGGTDTIVERLAGTNLPGGTDTVPIELVALSLHSVAPITISNTQFDLQVLGGSLLGIPQTPGQMTITLTEPNGGVFDAILPVNARLVFTQVGNPSNQILTSFFDVFVSIEIPWTFDEPSHQKRGDDFPPGGFFPGIDPVTGQKVLVTEIAQLARHGVIIQAPAPDTLALFVLGLAALAAVRSRSARSTGRPAVS